MTTITALTGGGPLVGRERELAVLRDRLARAADGRGSAVLVTGEAGLGKSRLVRQLATEAVGRGGTVLEGRCVAVGGDPLRHAALVELVRAARRPGHEAPQLAGATSEAVLERMLGVVEGVVGVAGAGGRGGATAAGAPLLLVVEDLHWADRGTCEVLMVLARHVLALPVCLVLTCRDDELPRGHHVRVFLAELDRAQLVLSVGLHRLGAAHVAELVVRLLGPAEPAVAARIFRRSGGNPLFVEELCAGGAAGAGEPSLDDRLLDVLLARVDGLSPAALAAARAVAAAGRPVDEALLLDVLGDDRPGQPGVGVTAPPGPGTGLREALDRHLLVRSGDDIGFRHLLVAEAVHAQMLRSERAAVHRRWAAALAERGDDPGVLAHHWAEAGDAHRALGASVAAGDAALVALAPMEAVGHYRRALGLWDAVADAADAAGCPRSELCVRAAEAANWSGDPAAGVEIVGIALAEPGLGERDPALRSRLLERQGWYLLRQADTAAARRRYLAAVEGLPADAPAAERARVLSGSVRIWERTGEADTALATAREAVALADAADAVGERATAHYMLGRALLAAGRTDEALDALAEAATWAERGGNAITLSHALADRADALATQRRLDVAAAEAAAAADRLVAAGQRDPQSLLVRGVVAGVHHRLGRAPEARRAAEALAAEARTPATLALGHLLVGMADLDARALGDAREHLEMARFLAAPLFDGRLGGNLALGRAELALAEERADDARSAVDEGVAQVERTGDDELLGYLCLTGLRIVADRARMGDGRTTDRARVDAAAAVDRYERRLATLTTAPAAGSSSASGPGAGRLRPVFGTMAVAWRAERSRLAGTSDPDAWAEAAEWWTAVQQPRWAALATLRRAEALAARPDGRADAPGVLAEALAAASAMGNQLLADQVRRVARRANVPLGGDDPGASPPVDPGSRVAPLTRREREVLELVATGATNREIGAVLYISTKTASVHVSRILAKLGAATREEAAAIAQRAGVTRGG